MSKTKKKTKKVKKPAKPSLIKRLYRRFRDWEIRLDERQRICDYTVPIDDTEHTCQHCGSAFVGRYCSQCGKPAHFQRFTWKLMIRNFLDIWGMGNRPMFRTIRDLFWRPGYMIRDYLDGHHLAFFPPFKMLAVWTLILLFLIWLFNAAGISVAAEDEQTLVKSINESLGGKVSSTTALLLDQLDRVLKFFNDNKLYQFILQNVLVVMAVKAAFKKVSDFNIIETFYSQIYINCQFHILACVSMLLTWRIPTYVSLFPYMKGVIPAFLVLTYDFHQLYGLKWKRSLWKTIVTMFNLLILYTIILLVIIAGLFMVEHFTNPESVV